MFTKRWPDNGSSISVGDRVQGDEHQNRDISRRDLLPSSSACFRHCFDVGIDSFSDPVLRIK
jgi:hypothetical protein